MLSFLRKQEFKKENFIMPNNPESGENGEVPVEARLSERVEQAKGTVAEYAEKVFREGGEEAAANFCVTIELVSRLMGAHLPKDVSRKDYVRGIWMIEKGLTGGIIFGAAEGSEGSYKRVKAVAEDAYPQVAPFGPGSFPDNPNLTNAIRKSMQDRLGSLGSEGGTTRRDVSL